MTPDEVGNLVALAASNFPHLQEKEMGPAVILWGKMLSDFPYDLAEAAVCKVLATSKYWPNVAEIREAALSLTGNAAPLPADAWAMVREAIRRDLPAEKLHPAIQRAVRGMGGLDGIGYAEVPIGVLQTQFMRLYEPLARDEQTQAQLPEAVREFISGMEVKQIAGAGQ